MKNMQNRGITLIALIITIIIMLILAGVAINAIINGNMSKQAKTAAEETRGAQVEEERDLWFADQDTAEDPAEVKDLEIVVAELQAKGLLTEEEADRILNGDGKVEIGARSGNKAIIFRTVITGDNPEPSEPGEGKLIDLFDPTGTDPHKLKVGDYVKYSPSETSATYTLENPAYASSETNPSPVTMTRNSTTNNLGWRILDINDGELRLISDTSTTSTVKLHGVNGYNNCVKILDELCNKLYNNSSFASKVQNLKIEDIQEYLTYDYTSYTNYGKTFSPTANTNYPSILTEEKNQLNNGETGLERSEQEDWYTGLGPTVTTLNVTYTYWNKLIVKPENKDFSSDIYYELFIKNVSPYPDYWLSSRSVASSASHAQFGTNALWVNGSGSTYITGNTLCSFTKNISYSTEEFGVRPAVTLKNTVKVTGGDGTTGWIIE